MTCVVGLVHGGTVWIGADSAATDDIVSVRYATPKVFRRGKLLFGVIDSFRMRDILHHDLEITRRPPGMSDDKYLVQHVVEDIRAAFEAAGFDPMTDNEDDVGSGAVLIGYHGRLWCMDWDYHLGETVDGYIAIGSGADYALGSLHTSSKLWSRTEYPVRQEHPLDPKPRVLAALQASAHCSQTVRAPFKVLSVR